MFKREIYLNQLIKLSGTEFIKIITGVRRSGKSFLLQLYKQYLEDSGIEEKQIVYLNFEEYKNATFLDDKVLYDYLEKKIIKQEKMYFLFDEIQDVSNWQRLIAGIRVTFNCEIVITGSNAKMLSGELASSLAGRYVEVRVFPLSFREIVEVIRPNYDKRQLPKMFESYVEYGGFPAVVLATDEVKEVILEGIRDTVVLNDIATRGQVRDLPVLNRIIRYLSDNIGQLVSCTKISDTLTSANMKASTPTVVKYIELMENAFLFYSSNRYDIRGKEYLRQQGKYYIVDSGLRHTILKRRIDNRGAELENIVFIELLRRGYSVDVGKLDNKEIDFIARKMDEVLYIQVALELPHDRRETDNLLLVKDNYKKIVITQKLENETEIDGIPIINIIDWLLND